MRGQDPAWEPAEFVNEMNETRWQPCSGGDRLWETAAGPRWRPANQGDSRDPKLYKNRLRAYRVGKRKFRKSASATWTEMQTGGVVGRITYWDDEQKERDLGSEFGQKGSGWRQSDHGEEVHE